MKKFILILRVPPIAIIINCMLSTANVFAQAPQAIPYQAVARDVNGNLIANQSIGLQFTVHDGSIPIPSIYYQETQSVTSSALGLFNVSIGNGTPVVGTFDAINWAGGGGKLLKVEMDVTGGASYTDMGNTVMESVPYSLYSTVSGNGLPAGTSGITDGTAAGNTLYWDGTAWVNDHAVYVSTGGFGPNKNIGINTDAPTATLHIEGNENMQVKLTNISTGPGIFDGLQIGLNGINTYLLNMETSDLLLGTSAQEQMRITSTGDIGVGTTLPASKLEVVGKITAQNLKMTNGATNNYLLRSDAAGNATWVNPLTISISESDPEVNCTLTNNVPKWNGSQLVNGSIYDDNGNIGIGTTSPLFKLSIGNSGGILAQGTINTGDVLPNLGIGQRMIWYPRKGAFRAGFADADCWDSDSIGVYSAAFGEATKATGPYSFSTGQLNQARGFGAAAFGVQSIASGDFSTTFGSNTIASNLNSAAFGFGSLASGNAAFAVGFQTEATAPNSTAFGFSSKASGNKSVAFGENTWASGENSLAIGYLSIAGGSSSFALGDACLASGVNSIAGGIGSVVTQLTANSVAIGFGDSVTASNAYAGGQFTTANGNQSFAFGNSCRTNADNSIAMGKNAIAGNEGYGQEHAVAIGNTVTADGENSVVIGTNSVALGNNSVAIGTRAVSGYSGSFTFSSNEATNFVAQAQNSMNCRFSGGYNFFTEANPINLNNGIFFKNGNIGLGENNPEFRLNMTNNGSIFSVGSFDAGIALPYQGNYQGTKLLWFPQRSAFRAGTATGTQWSDSELGTYSFGSGYNTIASGNVSTAMGRSTTASGDHSTALGNYVSTNGFSGSLVIGDHSTSTVMNAASNNSFRARFDGGYRFYTDAGLTTNAYLAAGAGSWTGTSDRNKKENFAAINNEDILLKVSSFPITYWNYKAQPSTQRHIGCMAQDFYAAFHLDGESDTTINSLDIDGINMAAIQALKVRTDELKKATDKIDTLTAALAKLEQRVNLLAKENAIEISASANSETK